MPYLVGFFIVYTIATLATQIQYGIVGEIMPRFLLIGAVATLFMSLVFVIAHRLRRYDIVDTAWGLVFTLIAWVSFGLQHGDHRENGIQLLVTLMVTLWGLRLAYHIGQRLRHTTHEDPRYTALRKQWRNQSAVMIWLRIYVVQAMLALITMIPVIHINLLDHARWDWWTIGGIVVWVVGFVIEVIADRQLAGARRRHPGKLMRSGLWRYSRHPNYFGEITLWWGIGMMCFGSQFGWVGIAGPVLISYLIICVSGIPPAEARAATRPDWADYRRRTSVLIPLPPRS